MGIHLVNFFVQKDRHGNGDHILAVTQTLIFLIELLGELLAVVRVMMTVLLVLRVGCGHGDDGSEKMTVVFEQAARRREGLAIE